MTLVADPKNLRDLRDGVVWAAKTGQLNVLKAFAADGVDLAMFGGLALRVALRAGQSAVVEFLQQATQPTSAVSKPTLFAAVENGSPQLLRQLATVAAEDEQKSAMFQAVSIGRSESFDVLLPFVDLTNQRFALHLLRAAVESDNDELPLRLYSLSKLSLSEKTKSSVLRLAVSSSQLQLIEQLLEDGVDVKVGFQELEASAKQLKRLVDVTQRLLAAGTETYPIYASLVRNLDVQSLEQLHQQLSPSDLERLGSKAVFDAVQQTGISWESATEATFVFLVDHKLVDATKFSSRVLDSIYLYESWPALKAYIRAGGTVDRWPSMVGEQRWLEPRYSELKLLQDLVQSGFTPMFAVQLLDSGNQELLNLALTSTLPAAVLEDSLKSRLSAAAKKSVVRQL